MKRKYLSALLMGALTVTSVSTFTSCKDYDSDISNLQGQIDKAALKTEVEAMKTTVEAAKTAAESAKTTAEKNATDLTEVKAKAEKLATQVAEALQTGKDAKAAADEAKDQCDELELKFFEYYTAEEVDKALDKLEAKIDANTESIEDLKAEVESYSSNINKLYSAVTGVSLVLSDGLEFNGALNFTVGNIATADGKDYTFGVKEIDDKEGEHSATPTYTYVNKAQFSRPNEILVRVNPVNATLTKDMIKFVDSKGGDLNNLVEVESVSKYDQYITKASETGLWRVQVNLKKPYNKKTVEQGTENNHIAYALAVNNTASQSAEGAEDRWVVSTYDLTVTGTEDYSHELTTDLKEIKVNTLQIADYDAPIVSVISSTTSVQSGEDIVVSFEAENLSKQVDRFYVVRDDKHAGDDGSGTSEINAWNKYQYEGLNKIVAVENGVGKATIRVTIPSSAKAGDEIQFRVFAMNYDGTLVEENGRAFRVFVGAKTTNASVEGTAEITGFQKLETEWLPISGTLKDGDDADKSLVKNSNKKVAFTNEDGQEINVAYELAKDAKGTAAAKDSEVKYIKFTLDESAMTEGQQNHTINLWPNDGTLTATISDANDVAVNSINVSLKKSMPTPEEAAKLVREKLYNWAPGALAADSTYTAYMLPSSTQVTGGSQSGIWSAVAEYAFQYMTSAITGLSESFSIKIADVEDGAAIASPFAFNIAKDDFGMIDSETPHVSTIYYNFGKISSEETEYNVTPEADFCIPVETYKTVFACPLDDSVQKFDWIEAPTGCKLEGAAYVLTYSKINEITWGDTQVAQIYTTPSADAEASNANLLDYLVATNGVSNKEYGGSLKELLNGKARYMSTDITATLTSDDTKKADFYDVAVTSAGFTFTPKGSNPKDNVPSTLTIKLKDAFGHTHVIAVPFTVKKN